MLKADQPIAILLHGGILDGQGKTGLAMLRFSEANIVVVIDRECAGRSLQELTGIPREVPIVASITEALAYEPAVLVIGIAILGGALPPDWQAEIAEAIREGMSIANGLHTRLGENPNLVQQLQQGQWIWDLRQEPANLPVATAAACHLRCRRVLTIGTDMAVGKMSTSLSLDRLARQWGLRSRFLGTGQAGILIAGDGIPLDAIRVDFAAGAVEQLVMRHGDAYDLLLIEGQGSLLHPASTATLPLMRGSQPTHLVLVHRAGQTHIRHHPHISIPPLSQVIPLYESLAGTAGTFTAAKVVAISLNTHGLDGAAAQAAIATTQRETGLPCTDPIRFGAEPILEAILATSINAQL
jgi:uncharacterized NAD-dependent epimerase/dehydratase family protein